MSTHASPATVPDAHDPVDHGTTERELERNLLFGIAVGTPVMFLAVVGMCLLAGTSLGVGMSVAVLPSVFGGLFFAGIVPLLGQCARQERFQHEARLAMAVPAPVQVDDDILVPAVV
jgi:hypothetical protein